MKKRFRALGRIMAREFSPEELQKASGGHTLTETTTTTTTWYPSGQVVTDTRTDHPCDDCGAGGGPGGPENQ